LAGPWHKDMLEVSIPEKDRFKFFANIPNGMRVNEILKVINESKDWAIRGVVAV
jgi:hypothetical protein